MCGNFSNGPGQAEKWLMIFTTGRAHIRKMSFSTTGPGYKKKEDEYYCMSVRVEKKDKVFKPADKRSINNEIAYKKYKYANKIYLSVFITGL